MKIRFTCVNAPKGKDQDRVMDLPNEREAGLVPEMFLLSASNVGASVVATDGDYVRTWTLLEW